MSRAIRAMSRAIRAVSLAIRAISSHSLPFKHNLGNTNVAGTIGKQRGEALRWLAGIF